MRTPTFTWSHQVEWWASVPRFVDPRLPLRCRPPSALIGECTSVLCISRFAYSVILREVESASASERAWTPVVRGGLLHAPPSLTDLI